MCGGRRWSGWAGLGGAGPAGTHVKKKEHKLYGAFAKDVDLSKSATKITFNDDDD